MKVISFLKPLAHAEKEAYLKSKTGASIGYDDHEGWVQSFYDRGFLIDVARHQLNASFFEHEETESIVTFLKHVQSLKVKKVIYLLPANIQVSKKNADVINEKITVLIKLGQKYKMMTIIEPTTQSYKSLMYVIKAFKSSQLGVVFSPSHIVKTQGTTLGQYRLFKKYIQYFVCHDMTKDLKPALIGYGNSQLLSLFKRLKKDAYKGQFILDPPFEDMLTSFQKSRKSVFKIFRKKELSKYEQLKSMLHLTEDKPEIQLAEIYHHQYEVLNTIFRLR